MAPVSLIWWVSAHSRLLRSTEAIAARWKQPSQPAIASATAAGLRMSPSISATSRGILASEPVDKSSSTRTRWPRSSSASHKCEPIKPQPPVTRYSDIADHRAWKRCLGTSHPRCHRAVEQARIGPEHVVLAVEFQCLLAVFGADSMAQRRVGGQHLQRGGEGVMLQAGDKAPVLRAD